MFFVFSKILAFLTSPINWIFFIFLFAILSKNQLRKKRAFITSFVLLVFFTNGFISNQFMKLVEMESVSRSELVETYEMGILLGGMISIQSDTTLISFNQNGDRLFQTIELYRSGKIKKILISSGSGMVQLQSFKESYLIKKYLGKIGVPSEDVFIETISNNTYQNAVESKKTLEQQFGDINQMTFPLITSASHMRRAKGCFQKQGINVIPYSTTKRVKPGTFIFRYEMILPDPHALSSWKVIMHELIGYTIYKFRGYL